MKGLWTGVECTQSGKSVSKVCFQLLVQAVDITASHPSAHQSAIRVADNSVDLLQSRDITLFEHFKRPPFLTERKAFRAGARYAQEISAVTVERPCDIVIASAYPNDYNLWQAGKARTQLISPSGREESSSSSPRLLKESGNMMSSSSS